MIEETPDFCGPQQAFERLEVGDVVVRCEFPCEPMGELRVDRIDDFDLWTSDGRRWSRYSGVELHRDEDGGFDKLAGVGVASHSGDHLLTDVEAAGLVRLRDTPFVSSYRGPPWRPFEINMPDAKKGRQYADRLDAAH